MTLADTVARPTKKSTAVLDRIYEGLAVGTPLTVICEPDDMPAARTVRDWEGADEEVSAAIARAREAGEWHMAWECKQIADTPAEGVIEKYEAVEINDPDDPDGGKVKEFQLVERRVEDMLGHRKLQVETRLKLLAKFNPKRWGDRLQHANDPIDPMPAPQFIVQPVMPAPRADDDV